MKKLLSILAVIGLVTSAFAFTNYKGIASFCIKQAGGTACGVIQNVMIHPDGAHFQHYPLGTGQWDGTVAKCVAASPVTDCTTPITLRIN
jgi:hypothetical protein